MSRPSRSEDPQQAGVILSHTQIPPSLERMVFSQRPIVCPELADPFDIATPLCKQPELFRPYGREATDADLKPLSLWCSTGKVKPGETGPGCSVNCLYCNQKALDMVDGQRQASYLIMGVDGGLSINTRRISSSSYHVL